MNMFNFVRAFSNCFLYAFQISRQQHELVKNMKQSGKSIQSRSLNRVLGNLEKIHVQPYNTFVKEEQKKLQEHWLVRCSQCYLLCQYVIEQIHFENFVHYFSFEYFICIGCY